MREAGAVRRCHTFPVHGEYNNAVHTFNMMAMLFELYPHQHPPRTLIEALLHHDLAERVTGDSPAPLKRGFPEIKKQLDAAEEEVAEHYDLVSTEALSEEERQWLKGLDLLEYLFWAYDQVAMGNRAAERKVELMTVRMMRTDLPLEVGYVFQKLCEQGWRRTKYV